MKTFLPVLLLFASSPVWAAGELAPAAAATEAPGVEAMLVKLFAWTSVLLVLCAGIFWLSRRMQRPPVPGTKSGGLEYIASAPLNRKCALHVIEANGQRMVVATDLTGIREIVPLTESFSTVLQQAGEI